MSTFLEAIAYDRDHADAEWEHAGRVGRRVLVLAVLADADAASRQAASQLAQNQPARYVSNYMLAASIAAKLGISGARRLGNQAMGPQSWTGYMSPALRVTPSLEAMRKAKLIRTLFDHEDPRTRYLYAITSDGRAYLDERTSDGP